MKCKKVFTNFITLRSTVRPKKTADIGNICGLFIWLDIYGKGSHSSGSHPFGGSGLR